MAVAPRPDPAAVAAGIRGCLVVMVIDLETLRQAARAVQHCTEAVRRLGRQVEVLNRWADELDPPPG